MSASTSRVLRCRIPGGGARFWTVFGQVLGRFETGVSFKNEIGRGSRAFKSCVRLRTIEIGGKLKNLRNQ